MIGRRPRAAFGNSPGDRQIIAYIDFDTDAVSLESIEETVAGEGRRGCGAAVIEVYDRPIADVERPHRRL